MTWNPTTGCTKISAGCKNCYAEIMTRRLKAMGQEKYKDGFKVVKVHPDSLKVPYTWKSPKVVFVNSMSDLFHEKIPVEFIKDVFKVMNDNPQHIFQLLTKRAEARKNKAWAESDKIRDIIKEKGYIVKDSKEGQTVEKI